MTRSVYVRGCTCADSMQYDMHYTSLRTLSEYAEGSG